MLNQICNCCATQSKEMQNLLNPSSARNLMLERQDMSLAPEAVYKQFWCQWSRITRDCDGLACSITQGLVDRGVQTGGFPTWTRPSRFVLLGLSRFFWGIVPIAFFVYLDVSKGPMRNIPEWVCYTIQDLSRNEWDPPPVWEIPAAYLLSNYSGIELLST